MSHRKPAPLFRAFGSLFLLLTAADARAACPSTADEVTRQAVEAADAFARLDEQGFGAARDSMREGLTCLADVPSPAQSALVHQAEVLAWFQARDRERAMAAARSMRESDPARELSEDLAPPGGELSTWLREVSDDAADTRVPQTVPLGCALLVDGVPRDSLPADRPSLVVLFGPEHEVAWSGLLPPGAGVPVIPALSLAGAAPPAAPRRPGRATLIAAGGSAVASAGLWAAAFLSRRELLTLQNQIALGYSSAEIGMDGEAASALYGRTQALFVAAEVGSGLSLGLGGLGLVLSW